MEAHLSVVLGLDMGGEDEDERLTESWVAEQVVIQECKESVRAVLEVRERPRRGRRYFSLRRADVLHSSCTKCKTKISQGHSYCNKCSYQGDRKYPYSST